MGKCSIQRTLTRQTVNLISSLTRPLLSTPPQTNLFAKVMRKGITEMGTSAQSCHLKLYPPFNLQACLVSHCSAHIPVCLSHNSLLPSSSYFLVSILQIPCYLCTWWPQPPTCRLSVPWPGPRPDLCLAGCQRSWLPWPRWLPELHFLWTCAGHSWPHAGPPVTHRVHPLPNLQPSDQQINNQVGAN